MPARLSSQVGTVLLICVLGLLVIVAAEVPTLLEPRLVAALEGR